MNPEPSPHIRLKDGTPALTRPIRPADGAALSRGLRRLSPKGHAYRFLHYRKRFTEAELHYLTHCDFIDHIALILAILDEAGNELDQVGVARCIRAKDDPQLAEVAIVLVDEWQRKGGGTALLMRLARLAWHAGIRQWKAHVLPENLAAPRVLTGIGDEMARTAPRAGLAEIVYRLRPPGAD
ncbi:MAG: GNAT family N-acetyltransferase [Terrimicrobiaceae bacterium]|nr:GNAT family N-acetyltransferase [Terrimicrobiaceae bacterium]